MICGFCGKEIEEKVGKDSCGHCPGGCRKIHCPHCGYTNPAPGKLLRRLLGKNKEDTNTDG